MDQIVLIGTGGLANEITDFIERYALFEVVGYTMNRAYMKEDSFRGKQIFPIEELSEFVSKDNVQVFSTVSWYNYLNRVRKEKFDELKAMGFCFANLISPNAVIYTKEIGEGNWIHDFVSIGYGTEIGNNNIFRMNSTIEHYSVIGNHNAIVTGAAIGGHVICGSGSFFGLNSIVFNRVRVGNRCVIGGGAVVKSDLPDFSLCVAEEPFIKQCSEEKIETYISPKHVKRSVEIFEKCKEMMKVTE